MSTTVYTAYRIPHNKLEDFKTLVTDYQFGKVADHVYDMIQRVNHSDFISWADNKKMDLDRFKNPKAELFHKFEYVIETQATPASQDLFRHPSTDIECGWNFYMDDQFFYMTPWGEPRTYENIGDQMPDWAEDFCYWNNTDSTPDGIEYDGPEWNHRREKWRELLNKPGWRNPFKLEIVRIARHNYYSHSQIERRVMAKGFGTEAVTD